MMKCCYMCIICIFTYSSECIIATYMLLIHIKDKTNFIQNIFDYKTGLRNEITNFSIENKNTRNSFVYILNMCLDLKYLTCLFFSILEK